MKDLRGISAAAIRNAILKVFGLQIPNSRKKSNIIDISDWKKSKRVKECYNRLYDDDENVIEDIAKLAFPNLSIDDNSFNNIYVYTASICVVLLNLKYPDLECAKKPLERRFQKFKVFFFVNFVNLN
ncbi:MAG TPA: hypothetical protein VM660_02240 [Bacillus sp. (in: firmicutes)]|nr:hypothetical protein [Bacillus sp. (in: firmicutes)]